MAVVPQLAGDENILTLQARNLGKRPLNTISDSNLISVNLGEVEVPVANLECFENGIANDLWATLPGAVAQSWEFVASIKKNGASGRHFGVNVDVTRKDMFNDQMDQMHPFLFFGVESYSNEGITCSFFFYWWRGGLQISVPRVPLSLNSSY